jgi:glyoxylase-like metal-dependent hydrolase (beta-lactamase superfamily II)
MPGASVEIAPGVAWLRLPLPGGPKHINVWRLADGDRVTVVDTGLNSAESIGEWERLFAAGDCGPIGRVIVTHMHPDHVGLAGWLTRRFHCPLWMTRLEYLHGHLLADSTDRDAPPEELEFYRAAGWSAAALEHHRKTYGRLGRLVQPLPHAFRRICDGDELTIGVHRWRVVVGCGHSPEHACLYCPELKLLISGDQVLPRISSNVSVQPTEPQADPMRDWLASLRRLRREIPDDVLVLPSHGPCFRGLHARLGYLLDSQRRHFGRLRRVLAQRRRAVDLFATLFGRAVAEDDGTLLRMATGESLACLNYLLHRGEVRRHRDADGVAWYERSRPLPAARNRLNPALDRRE